MKLSIVVPVYNVEKYIVKCISSLLNQNFDDYEIIVVDDGSPDRSIEILKENISDDRMQIVHQENQGLSGARNTGLSLSKGEYVWFFDSDDWVSENSLMDIVKKLVDCDICVFTHYIREKESGESEDCVACDNTPIETGRELSMGKYVYPAQFYIYRRGYLLEKSLLFTTGLYHEDNLFTPIALYQAGKVVKYDAPVYHYLMREGSITHNISPKRCLDLMCIILALVEFSTKNILEKDRYLWGNCIAQSMNGLLFHTLLQEKNVQNEVSKFVESHREILPYLCHAKKPNTRVLGYLSLYLHFSLWTLYKIFAKVRY